VLLKFSRPNAKLIKLQKKLNKRVYSLDLLSGWSCPFADKCYSKVIDLPNGKHKIKDGINTEFRCYSASEEAFYTQVYNYRKRNFDLLRKSSDKVKLLEDSLPSNAEVIRIHSSGEMYQQNYFDCWLSIARNHPDITFYTYTKSIPYWIKRLNEIPENFSLTASYGGKKDDLIEKYRLRYCKVVFSKYEARKSALPIDHDDSHAVKRDGNFALLLHGVQPAGKKSAKRWDILKKTKQSGYSRS